MTSLNEQIGKRIALLRKEQHMTQAELAEALDISIKHCSSVERGLARLSLEKLIDTTKLLHTDLDYLILGKCNSNQYMNLFPDALLNALSSGDEEQILLFKRYLQMYGDLLEKGKK